MNSPGITGTSSISCITFDLDDTLWETGPLIDRAERIAHAWLQQHAPNVVAGRTQNELLEHRRAHYATLPQHSHDLTKLRRDWLVSLAVDAGYSGALGEQAFEVFWLARNDVTLFDDAIPLLNNLRPQFRLGTITNGNADVAHIGLDEWFQFSVTAANAGVMKPDPRIFEHALGFAGVAPAQTLHVGDDPVTDIQGAKAAGMYTVWVNAVGLAWDSVNGDPPDAVIANVGQLSGVLLGWGALPATESDR